MIDIDLDLIILLDSKRIFIANAKSVSGERVRSKLMYFFDEYCSELTAGIIRKILIVES